MVGLIRRLFRKQRKHQHKASVVGETEVDKDLRAWEEQDFVPEPEPEAAPADPWDSDAFDDRAAPDVSAGLTHDTGATKADSVPLSAEKDGHKEPLELTEEVTGELRYCDRTFAPSPPSANPAETRPSEECKYMDVRTTVHASLSTIVPTGLEPGNAVNVDTRGSAPHKTSARAETAFKADPVAEVGEPSDQENFLIKTAEPTIEPQQAEIEESVRIWTDLVNAHLDRPPAGLPMEEGEEGDRGGGAGGPVPDADDALFSGETEVSDAEDGEFVDVEIWDGFGISEPVVDELPSNFTAVEPDDSEDIDEAFDIFDFDPDAQQAPWRADELPDGENTNANARQKAALLAPQVNVRDRRELDRLINGLTELFQERPHPQTRRALVRLVDQGLSSETLWQTVSLREVWESYPGYWLERKFEKGGWQIRRSPNGRCALSWQQAFRIVLVRWPYPPEAMIAEDWLEEWLHLSPGQAGFHRFLSYLDHRLMYEESFALTDGLRLEALRDEESEIADAWKWTMRFAKPEVGGEARNLASDMANKDLESALTQVWTPFGRHGTAPTRHEEEQD